MHVIGTAGHVDHGKSTLVERLTGIDPDRFAEEKRRGLTIDLGFAWLRLPSGNEIGIIDVPGHERFIRNMLAGAGGTTVCLFVVAANEGWKPQSAEHLAILHVLGVSRAVVALTKSDTVDETTRARVKTEVRGRLAGSSLAEAPIVACSAKTGDGLEMLVGELDRVVQAAGPAPDKGRPRLWIDRVFTIAGSGTVVTGTLGGGALSKGDTIEIAPDGRRARIRSIQSHKKELDRAEAGNRVALNLVGLQHSGAERGHAVVLSEHWRPTDRLFASLQVLDPSLAGAEHELSEKGAHLLYVGSAETPVRIRLIGTERIGPGANGFAELRLRDPLPLARGDRFVLRDVGRVLTFGGGSVLDPLPTLERRHPSLLPLLQELSSATEAVALHAILNAEGAVSERAALLRTGLVSIPASVRRLGAVLVSNDEHERLEERLVETLTRHHREHPLAQGISRTAARAEVLPDDAVAFDHLVAGTPLVVEDEANLRLGTHQVTFDSSQDSARGELMEQLDSSGFNPPLENELPTERALLDALVAAGDLVRIANFYLTADRARAARQRVRAQIEAAGPMTVAQIRDLLETSRKYAVPLVEWLDATGATIRKGDLRLLGPRE